MGSTPKPTPKPGYVNLYLDVETAETLYVALSYALGIQAQKKKKKKKKKKGKSPTPKPAPK
jgi:hypothetical protein